MRAALVAKLGSSGGGSGVPKAFIMPPELTVIAHGQDGVAVRSVGKT